MRKDFKEYSKTSFVTADGNQPTNEQLILGCMQRIADSSELMAKIFLKLQSDNEYLTRRNKNLNEQNEHFKRSANTYKGKYNSLKNRNSL